MSEDDGERGGGPGPGGPLLRNRGGQRSERRRFGRCGWRLAGALCSLLLPVALIGCGVQGEPEPPFTGNGSAATLYGPPPTVDYKPVTAEPPADVAEALKDAERLVGMYYQARSHLWRNPEDTAPLLLYANGPQAEVDLKNAQEAIDQGLRRTGRYRFKPDMDSAYAQTLHDTIDGVEQEILFGHVTIPGCHDISELHAERTDPVETVPFGQPPRFQVVATIVYDQLEGRWVLVDLNLPNGEWKEC